MLKVLGRVHLCLNYVDDMRLCVNLQVLKILVLQYKKIIYREKWNRRTLAEIPRRDSTCQHLTNLQQQIDFSFRKSIENALHSDLL